MKLQTFFTVEYNVPVHGAVRRRIRVRQPSLTRKSAATLPLPQSVWIAGVALACGMALLGSRLTPDEPQEQVRETTVREVVVAAAPIAENPIPITAEVRSQDAAVRDALLRWADAWSRRDVGGYVAAYSPDYSGQAGDRASWERERRSRIEARRHIRVDLSDIEIDGGTDMVRVTFSQSYRSDALQETTRKTLTLIRSSDDRWLIVRET
jgi:ketosteroid isomerase-like protein